MHIKCYVYTKEFPTDDVLEEMLEPFAESDFYSEERTPVFTWDWWEIGGRYSACLKLKAKEEDPIYHWEYENGDPRRAGRLFRSSFLEFAVVERFYLALTDETRYARYCGLRDGFLYCDGGKISDLIDFDKYCSECYCFIDSDGTGHCRELENGDDSESFDREAQEAYERNRDGYVTVIDMHF